MPKVSFLSKGSDYTHFRNAKYVHVCFASQLFSHAQIVFGLERLVDMTIARSVPQVAYGTTIAIRFVNNVIGGENFIDMARWAGVQ